MDPATWERIRDLFDRALDLPASDREALLAQEPDPQIRAEVGRLLDGNPERAIIDEPALRLKEFFAPREPLAPGDQLGPRYRIEKRIASGGMGDVYAAFDNELKERVALKSIRADIMGNPAIASRFRREISLARRVSHPNVCRVYDLCREDHGNLPFDFLTMELIEGETLSQWIRREAPIPFETAKPVLRQICEGLAAAHDSGIVHRDFKGSNVLLARRPDGSLRAAVADFGLARSVNPSSDASTTGFAAGTPAYMAPEQMEGNPVGPRADLYALGIVMYEMATGAAPHPGESPLQIAVKRVKQAPASPRSLNPGIDPAWERAILKCLAYDPEDRPKDARALAAMLDSGAPRFTVPGVRLRRPKRLFPALAGFLLAAASGLWFWTRPPRHLEEAERWYRRGTDLLMDGAYSSARASLEAALKVEPDYGIARARLADVFYELDMPEDSQREIARASSGDRDENLLIEGIRLTLQRKFPEALERMEARVKRARTVDALLDRARVLERADRLDDAIAAFRLVLQRDPSNAGALLRLAQLLQLKGGFSEEVARSLQIAEDAYKRSASLEGQASVLLASAAAQSRENGRKAVELALLAKDRAAAAKSETLELRASFAYGRYLAQTGDVEKAKTVIAAGLDAAAKAGGQALAATGLADFARLDTAAGRHEEAAAKYKEALELAERVNAPRTVAFIKRVLGGALLRLGRVDEAVRLIDEAQQFYTSNGYLQDGLQCRLLLAESDGQRGQVDSALTKLYAILAEAAKLPGAGPVLARTRLTLGPMLATRGHYKAALPVLADAIRDSEASGQKAAEHYARIYHASTLRKFGKFAEARASLEKVLAGANLGYHDLARQVLWAVTGAEGKTAEAIASIMRYRAERKPKRGDLTSRLLCSFHAEASQWAEAARWCDESLYLVAEGDNATGSILPALIEIDMANGRWESARVRVDKLAKWAASHSDPEIHLLAHLLSIAVATRGGRKPVSPDALQAWRQARANLEAEWGPEAVTAIVDQIGFRRHIRLISGG